MKNKTVICHIYNEEYLLPWWLKHHREIFDQGLIINYGSNDNSIEIIKELCPSWKIVDTKNEFFGAQEIDREIEEYEKDMDGYRIVLNVTEFLVGNISKLEEKSEDIYIPMASMVDTEEQEHSYPLPEQPLTKQRLFGIKPNTDCPHKSGCRLLHQKKDIRYPIGRHYWKKSNDEDFYILRYKHAPWNKLFIERKMQIGQKQPESDLSRGWGLHHQYGEQQLKAELLDFRKYSEDLSPLIQNLEYTHYNKP